MKQDKPQETPKPVAPMTEEEKAAALVYVTREVELAEDRFLSDRNCSVAEMQRRAAAQVTHLFHGGITADKITVGAVMRLVENDRSLLNKENRDALARKIDSLVQGAIWRT